MKTNYNEKYETMYDYTVLADISHYSMSVGAIPVWPGIVWVEAFKPRDDPDFSVSHNSDVSGYVKVNWGEDFWCLLREDALNDEVYARYEYWDGEFNSIGGVFETEEKAWDGWKSVDEMYTPMIYAEDVTKDIEEFIDSANDIGVDKNGYIWMENFGYFEDIDDLKYEMNHRREKVE